MRFEPSGGGAEDPQNDGLNFSDVVARPDHARSVFKKWRVVVVRASNGRHLPGRYLNRYDRNKIPGGRIELYIYENPERMLCRAQPFVSGGSADCPRFNELARNPPALDEDGLIVVPPLPPPASPGYVTYIFPAAEFVSATNEAIYFQCDVLSAGVPQYYSIILSATPFARTCRCFINFRHPIFQNTDCAISIGPCSKSPTTSWSRTRKDDSHGLHDYPEKISQPLSAAKLIHVDRRGVGSGLGFQNTADQAACIAERRDRPAASNLWSATCSAPADLRWSPQRPRPYVRTRQTKPRATAEES